MSTSADHTPAIGEKAVLIIPGNYQPIHLEDTVRAIFPGIFASIFLIGWVRAEVCSRTLLTRRKMTDESS
jgi:hypothetical protein